MGNWHDFLINFNSDICDDNCVDNFPKNSSDDAKLLGADGANKKCCAKCGYDYMNANKDDTKENGKENEPMGILSCDLKHQNNLHRLDYLMFSLFERFAICETTFHDLLNPETLIFDPTERNKNLRIKYFLEIAMHMTSYCFNIIRCRSRSFLCTVFPSIIDEDIFLMERISSGPHKLTGVIQNLLNQVKGLVDFYLKLNPIVGCIHEHICVIINGLDDEEEIERFKMLNAEKNEFQHNILTLIEQSLHLIWIYFDYYMQQNADVVCLKCGKSEIEHELEKIDKNLYHSKGSKNNKISDEEFENYDMGKDESDDEDDENEKDLFENNSDDSCADYENVCSLSEIDDAGKIILDTFNSTFCAKLLSITEDTKDRQEDFKAIIDRIMKLVE